MSQVAKSPSERTKKKQVNKTKKRKKVTLDGS